MKAIVACPIVLLFALPAHSATIHVPGDQPTIQAGIDAAALGDTVEVACGTYFEHDIVLKSGITLRGETGDAACVIIDGQGIDHVIRGCAIFEPTVVEGLTITNGDGNHGGGITLSAASVLVRNCVITACRGGHGGGVALYGAPSPAIQDCVLLENSALYIGGGVKVGGGASSEVLRCQFIGNTAGFYGGGLGMDTPSSVVQECVFRENSADRYGGGAWVKSPSEIVSSEFLDNVAGIGGGGMMVTQSSPTLSDCVFSENTTPGRGGGIYCHSAAPVISHCTIVLNAAGEDAGGLFSGYGSSPSLHRTLIAFSTLGAAVSVDEPNGIGHPALSCCDLYGNVGGDWVDAIADQATIEANFSADPLFCDPDNSDFTIRSDSPCAPPGVTGCGLVGALPVGCGPIVLKEVKWGSIKHRYR